MAAGNSLDNYLLLHKEDVRANFSPQTDPDATDVTCGNSDKI